MDNSQIKICVEQYGRNSFIERDLTARLTRELIAYYKSQGVAVAKAPHGQRGGGLDINLLLRAAQAIWSLGQLIRRENSRRGIDRTIPRFRLYAHLTSNEQFYDPGGLGDDPAELLYAIWLGQDYLQRAYPNYHFSIEIRISYTKYHYTLIAQTHLRRTRRIDIGEFAQFLARVQLKAGAWEFIEYGRGWVKVSLSRDERYPNPYSRREYYMKFDVPARRSSEVRGLYCGSAGKGGIRPLIPVDVPSSS